MNTGKKPKKPCEACSKVVAHNIWEYPLPHKCPHGLACKHGQSGAKGHSLNCCKKCMPK